MADFSCFTSTINRIEVAIVELIVAQDAMVAKLEEIL